MSTDMELAEEVVAELAAIPDRGSATPGERTAAGRVADWLGGRVETERAHGTHWWPYGLPPALTALTGSRLVGLLAAAAVVEDVEGPWRLLRRLLPQRDTFNVIAEIGAGPRTIVVHAHHDAAHGGVMFHPAVAQPDGPVPTLALVAGFPLLVALGARRAGRILCAVTAALFADSGRRAPVPGANDDASGVAALALLARRLRAAPPDGVRVILLSTGSEEAMLEGMTAFARRHFRHLDRATTSFVSVDSLGWETLALRSGEGALRQRPASPRLVSVLRACAREQGVELREGVRFWIPTDGNVALRAGYAQVTLGSVQPDGGYPGYHTPQDTPDRVHHETIVRGADLIEALVRASHSATGEQRG